MACYAIYTEGYDHHYGNFEGDNAREALNSLLSDLGVRSIENAAEADRCSVKEYLDSFVVEPIDRDETENAEFETIAAQVDRDGSGYAHGLVKTESYCGQWYATFSSLGSHGYETRIHAGYIGYYDHLNDEYGNIDDRIVRSVRANGPHKRGSFGTSPSPEFDEFGEDIVDSNLNEIRCSIRDFIDDMDEEGEDEED